MVEILTSNIVKSMMRKNPKNGLAMNTERTKKIRTPVVVMSANFSSLVISIDLVGDNTNKEMPILRDQKILRLDQKGIVESIK